VAFAVTAVRRPRYALLSGSALALTCFFNSVYPDGAIDRYYIGPALIAWTWLAILAAALLEAFLGWERAGRRRAIGLGIAAVVLLAPTAMAFWGRAQIVDRSEDTIAQRWTDEVLSAVEPNAVIVSWWSYSTPLWYATIVDGRRPDVTIVDDRNRVDQNLGDLNQVIASFFPARPVYLIRNGPTELPAVEARYDLEPIGASLASNVLRVVYRTVSRP